MKRELIYAAVIGGVVGAVLVAAAGSFAPLGAQSQSDGNFGKITCSELEVVSPNGKNHVWLLAGNAAVYVELGGDKHGGVHLIAADDEAAVRVSGKDGHKNVLMSFNERGGRVDVYDKDGKSSAYMSVHENGGLVSLKGKDGGGSLQMSIDKYGGYVGVYGRGNDYSRAVMSVNEYGNGAVSTWDKNRYRLATLK